MGGSTEVEIERVIGLRSAKVVRSAYRSEVVQFENELFGKILCASPDDPTATGRGHTVLVSDHKLRYPSV